MSFLKNAGLLSINRMIGALLSIAISALSTRIVAPEEYGALVATIAAIAFAMRISSLGIGQASQYFGSKSLTASSSLLKSLLILTTIIFTLSILILSFAWEEIGQIILGNNPLAMQYFSWLWIGIPMTFVHFIASLYSLGRRELNRNFYLSVVPMVVSVVVLSWAIWGHLGIQALVISWLAQYVISLILGFAYLIKSLTRSEAPIYDGFKQLLHYGSASYLVFISSFFQNRIGILTGIWFTTTNELAFFTVANTLAESLLLFYGSVGPLALSYTGSMSQKEDSHYFIGILSRRMLVLLIFISILVAVGAPILLPIVFGNNYQGAHYITWILLPSVIFAAQQRILENYLYGIKKQIRLINLNFINIFVTLLLSSFLSPKYGAIGLAVSALISQLLSYIFTLVTCWHADNLNPLSLIIPNKADFCWIVKIFTRMTKGK